MLLVFWKIHDPSLKFEYRSVLNSSNHCYIAQVSPFTNGLQSRQLGSNKEEQKGRHDTCNLVSALPSLTLSYVALTLFNLLSDIGQESGYNIVICNIERLEDYLSITSSASL